MAAIQNDRDVLLQAATVRFDPFPIAIEDVTGLPAALNAATNAIKITASAMVFSGNSPGSITLTATVSGALVGPVNWSIVAGFATLQPSGNSCTIQNASMFGAALTVRASIGTVSADIVLTKLGQLSAQETVSLTNQVVGQLAMGNVTGYGALALLNVVNLNVDTVGALNGATQVTNLGVLAYANALYANQIGAGTLAVGVQYAGKIFADQITASGTITGVNLVGAARVAAGGSVGFNYQFDASTSGGPFEVVCRSCNFVAVSSGGYYTLIARGDGSELYMAPNTVTIDANSFGGSLGNRIVLKGVQYNATIDGVSRSLTIN